jgi:DNA invertase Pin-like site-specific DNA recombinase
MDHTLKPRLETLGRVVVWERALAAEIAREAAAADKHRIGRRPIATSKKAEILRLHDAGLGAGKIARRVGVGRTSVWRVVSEALAA